MDASGAHMEVENHVARISPLIPRVYYFYLFGIKLSLIIFAWQLVDKVPFLFSKGETAGSNDYSNHKISNNSGIS